VKVGLFVENHEQVEARADKQPIESQRAGPEE
jgi:hypothetical protein